MQGSRLKAKELTETSPWVLAIGEEDSTLVVPHLCTEHGVYGMEPLVVRSGSLVLSAPHFLLTTLSLTALTRAVAVTLVSTGASTSKSPSA